MSAALAAPAAGAAGATTAAAAIPGLNALLLPLLLSFGPAAINKLFGNDPQAQLRKQIMDLLNPQNQAALTEQLYRANLQSPAYTQGQNLIAAGANQTANQVAANLGARGIGTSGTGAVLSGLTPSLVGSQLAGLQSTAHSQAASQAQQTIQQKIAALTGTSGPSVTQNLFAGGLEAFGPYLQAYLRAKFPSLSTLGTPTAAR